MNLVRAVLNLWLGCICNNNNFFEWTVIVLNRISFFFFFFYVLTEICEYLWMFWLEYLKDVLFLIGLCDSDGNMWNLDYFLLQEIFRFFLQEILSLKCTILQCFTKSVAVCVLKTTYCNTFSTSVIVYGFKKHFMQHFLYKHCSILYYMQCFLRKHCSMCFFKTTMLSLRALQFVSLIETTQ